VNFVFVFISCATIQKCGTTVWENFVLSSGGNTEKLLFLPYVIRNLFQHQVFWDPETSSERQLRSIFPLCKGGLMWICL